MIAAGKISRLAVGDAAIRPAVQTYSVPQTLLQRDRMSEATAIRHAWRRRRPPLLSGGRRVPDPDPAAANARQPDSRPGRAERHRAAARPAARTRVQRGRRGSARSVVDGAERVAVRADRRREADRAAGDHGRPARSRRGVSREERIAGGRARAGAVGCDLRIRGRPRRSDGRRDDRDQRTVRRRRRWRYAEPPADLRLPREDRRRLRGDDPEDAGTARLSPSCRRRRRRRPVQFYRAGRSTATSLGPHGDPHWVAQHGDPQWVAYSFEAGIEFALRAMLVDPDFLFFVERDSGGRRSARRCIASAILELASRLSFFLWSTIPDDELLDARRTAAALGSGRARPAGRADACRPARRGARHELRRPVAAPAQHARASRRIPRRSPSSTKTSATRSGRRPSCSSSISSARTAASSSC